MERMEETFYAISSGSTLKKLIFTRLRCGRQTF